MTRTGHEILVTGHDQLISGHGNLFTGHENLATGHDNTITGHKTADPLRKKNNVHKTADQPWSWTGHDQLMDWSYHLQDPFKIRKKFIKNTLFKFESQNSK
jgi:hypothetical protein